MKEIMDKRKNVIKRGIGIALFLVFSINLFILLIGPLYEKGYKFISSEVREVYALPPIGPGEELRQSFVVDKDILSIEFVIGTYGNQYTEGYLQVGICEKENPDHSSWKQVPLSDLIDNGYYFWKLDQVLKVEKESVYELVIRGDGMTENQQITLIGTDEGSNRGECRLNGAVIGGKAVLNVYIRSRLAIALTVLFWFLMVLLCVAFFILLRRKICRSIEYIFFWLQYWGLDICWCFLLEQLSMSLRIIIRQGIIRTV